MPKGISTVTEESPANESHDSGLLHEDYLLKAFAAMAGDYERDEKGPFSVGLTLNVAGSIVSGQLVGPREWFQLQAEQFEKGSTEEVFMTTIGKNAVPDPETVDVDYVFLHLKDVRIYVANEQLSRDLSLWRGRISQVAGWSFGSLSPAED